MKQSDIDRLKEKLLEMRVDLENLDPTSRASVATVVLDQSSVGRLSRMDAMQGQQMALEAERRRKSLLLQVKAALIRMEKNDFGYCFKCGEDIAIGRLAINPTVTYCVSCSE